MFILGSQRLLCRDACHVSQGMRTEVLPQAGTLRSRAMSAIEMFRELSGDTLQQGLRPAIFHRLSSPIRRLWCHLCRTGRSTRMQCAVRFCRIETRRAIQGFARSFCPRHRPKTAPANLQPRHLAGRNLQNKEMSSRLDRFGCHLSTQTLPFRGHCLDTGRFTSSHSRIGSLET